MRKGEREKEGEMEGVGEKEKQMSRVKKQGGRVRKRETNTVESINSINTL